MRRIVVPATLSLMRTSQSRTQGTATNRQALLRTNGAAAASSLRGRRQELAVLASLVARARSGRSGTLIVSGEAGVGKTALVDQAVERAGPGVRVLRMVAAESEVELAYAGMQQLCNHMMDRVTLLPAPQRDALEAALGLCDAVAPSPFLVGLAILGLLTDASDDGPLLCIIDDAHWLDEASAQAIAFVARRLDAEGVALILVMRVVDHDFSDRPQLIVGGLGDDDAREILRHAVPGAIDRRVRDQLIAEARGNPLALQELPRGLSPAEIAGGFALARSVPLERRIEHSLVAQLEPLPESARQLLLLAAADPTGDPALLWRASAVLKLATGTLDVVEQTGMLVLRARVEFRHPLARSAIYRSSAPQDRRLVHAALAEATSAERDPDRRAWHRASATVRPDEEIAADLERSATRARARGGAAATAAFLERSAELTPDPVRRARRLIAAAEAKHDAGAPERALRLLDTTRDHALTLLQEALVERLRARASYAVRRDRDAPSTLLAAAQRLAPLDPPLARDTYLEALAAALYAGRLGDPAEVAAISRAILDATDNDDSDRARDLILRGQALLAAEGPAAAASTLHRALRAFMIDDPDQLELRWMWLGCRAAVDLWDADALRALADRQIDLARREGVLTVLPIALSVAMCARLLDGQLDAASAACDEVEVIKNVTGHPLPLYGRIVVAAFRGQVEEVERRAAQLRSDADARGEGYSLSVTNYAEAVVYNGLGRYADAVAAAQRELPFARELSFAMRSLPELIEAATREGDPTIAQEAFEQLRDLTRPVGGDWALGVLALAEAQLHDDAAAAERLYREAVERFERGGMSLLEGRARLLYGEALRRQHRRVDARRELRAAHARLSACGARAFAERAAHELVATGETIRSHEPGTEHALTPQELAVVRLAREGLTNRDIGSRLFISSRTAEYHLRKVFIKFGIRSRAELKSAFADLS
jgi:DNA-binding CsgD family transcriptional regulator